MSPSPSLAHFSLFASDCNDVSSFSLPRPFHKTVFVFNIVKHGLNFYKLWAKIDLSWVFWPSDRKMSKTNGTQNICGRGCGLTYILSPGEIFYPVHIYTVGISDSLLSTFLHFIADLWNRYRRERHPSVRNDLCRATWPGISWAEKGCKRFFFNSAGNLSWVEEAVKNTERRLSLTETIPPRFSDFYSKLPFWWHIITKNEILKECYFLGGRLWTNVWSMAGPWDEDITCKQHQQAMTKAEGQTLTAMYKQTKLKCVRMLFLQNRMWDSPKW